MANFVVEQATLLAKVRGVLQANGRRCEIDQPPAPPDGSQEPKLPYTIIYGIDGGDFYGGLGAPDACATAIVQLSHFARNGHDAGVIGDECRRILLGRANGVWLNDLNTASQKVGGRRSLGLPNSDPDDATGSRVERFEFLLSAG